MITKSKSAKRPSLAKAHARASRRIDAIQPTLAKPATAGPVDALLLLSQLEPSPTNPRKHFDEEELAGLAESVKTRGILEPILVRQQADYVKAGGQAVYEIVAGERRYRAAKLAKLKHVPCRIADLADTEVLEIQLIENLERKDLNAIEEAIGFQQILAGGMTQEKLAQKIGRTQAHISNRVRLLELPADWQERVIEGKLPATHARCLVAWKDLPQVMHEVDEELSDFHEGETPALAEFERLVRNAARYATFPLSDTEFAGGHYVRWTIKPKEADERELNLIDVPTYDGGTERRAVNEQAWQRLKKIAIEKAVAKKGGKATEKDDSKKPKLTPAQQKARDSEKAEQFAKRLYAWKINWLRRICDRRLATEGLKQDRGPLMMRLVLYGLTSNESAEIRDSQLLENRTSALVEILAHRGIKVAVGQDEWYRRTCNVWPALDKVPDEDLTALAVELVRSWLVNHDGADGWEPTPHLPPERVEDLAKKLGVSLRDEWPQWKGDNCLREYFELHTKQQLVELGRELGESPPGIRGNDADQPKSMLVEALLAHPCSIPQEILNAKEPKRC